MLHSSKLGDGGDGDASDGVEGESWSTFSFSLLTDSSLSNLIRLLGGMLSDSITKEVLSIKKRSQYKEPYLMNRPNRQIL